MSLFQLQRIRWGVRCALVLGVAASVTANVLHALDNPISQAIAAWPPLALLLTVELISRVPVHRPVLAAARLLATATIAGIAAWVSYWHMAGVASRYGETGAAPYLIPLSVDGLIVVASVCLVELSGRIRTTGEPAARVEVAHYDHQRPIGPMPARIPHRSIKAESVAASEKRRRVRHRALIRRVKVAHAAPCTTAGQEPLRDPRAAQDLHLVVCAIKQTHPDLPQRRIAYLAATSPTTVRRALRRTSTDNAAQPEDAVRDLESATA